MLRARLERTLGLENRNAGPFRSDQGTSDMETILQQKLIQVIAGHASRDIRKLLPHPVCVFVSQTPESLIDFATSPTLEDNGVNLFLGVAADSHPSPVIQENVERIDVID